MASSKISKEQLQKRIAVGVACFAAVWLYWNYLLKPLNKEIATLGDDLAQKQQQLDTTRQAAMDYEVLEAEYKILKIESAELEKKLPFKKDLPKLIDDITKSLEKNRINIQTFTPGQEVQKAYYSEMPIMLQVSGTYHTLAEFLADIGQYDRMINTFDLRISPVSPTSTSKDTVSASMRLVTYIGK